MVRAWGIVPAAVNERDVAEDLLGTGPPPRDLLADKGFRGAAFAAGQAARGTAILIPPAKGQRHAMPPILRKIIAEWRNRIETTFGEITDLMELARHGACTLLGTAHPHRRNDRRPHPLAPLPHQRVDQPT